MAFERSFSLDLTLALCYHLAMDRNDEAYKIQEVHWRGWGMQRNKDIFTQLLQNAFECVISGLVSNLLPIVIEFLLASSRSFRQTRRNLGNVFSPNRRKSCGPQGSYNLSKSADVRHGFEVCFPFWSCHMLITVVAALGPPHYTSEILDRPCLRTTAAIKGGRAHRRQEQMAMEWEEGLAQE